MKLSLLRGLANNESLDQLCLTWSTEYTSTEIVTGFSRQINGVLLVNSGGNSIGAGARRETRERTRAQLRRELAEIADNAVVEQAMASIVNQTP